MAKRITKLALFLAVAMIFSYIESLFPPLVAVPGVKAGFANIIIILMIERFNYKDVFAVAFLRILLCGLLFGNIFSMVYSLCGAVLSITVMLILKKSSVFSNIGLSIAGGISHNIGQILAAVFILGTKAILYYLPVLLISGLISGGLIGIISTVISHYLIKVNL